jgi:hypothetical protein
VLRAVVAKPEFSARIVAAANGGEAEGTYFVPKEKGALFKGALVAILM